VKTLRSTVSELMVRVHRISSELAASHAREMTPLEVKQRFLMYVRNRIPGAELSVVGPKSRAGNVSSTPFSRPATMTAGPRHSTLFPQPDRSEKPGTVMPDSEVKNGD
jgi:hypothetical protein